MTNRAFSFKAGSRVMATMPTTAHIHAVRACKAHDTRNYRVVITVRRAIYRGQEGWKISGRHGTKQTGGWPVSIFTLTRSSADHIARKVRAGHDIESSDFERR